MPSPTKLKGKRTFKGVSKNSAKGLNKWTRIVKMMVIPVIE